MRIVPERGREEDPILASRLQEPLTNPGRAGTDRVTGASNAQRDVRALQLTQTRKEERVPDIVREFGNFIPKNCLKLRRLIPEPVGGGLNIPKRQTCPRGELERVS